MTSNYIFMHTVWLLLPHLLLPADTLILMLCAPTLPPPPQPFGIVNLTKIQC